MDRRSSKTILKIYQGFSLCLSKTPYAKIATRDVIREAGVSPTGFYAHFKSKEDVCQGLFAKLFLTVKVRSGFDFENHLSLLFLRLENEAELWGNLVKASENEAFVKGALFPWCKAFLPRGESKTGARLAANLLVSSLIDYAKQEEKETPVQMASLLSEPLKKLLGL